MGAFPSDTFEPSLQKMSNTFYHRGPDDGGIWIDQEHGIGMGHRSLSIIDLSPAGHQSMHSVSDCLSHVVKRAAIVAKMAT